MTYPTALNKQLLSLSITRRVITVPSASCTSREAPLEGAAVVGLGCAGAGGAGASAKEAAMARARSASSSSLTVLGWSPLAGASLS